VTPRGGGSTGEETPWEKIETGEDFAMKVIHAARARRTRRVRAIFRDQKSLVSAHHPFIVFAFFFQTDPEVLLCLERAAGGDFGRNRKQTPRIRRGDGGIYISDHSLAITIPHVHGAIRCDLKPENLLIG
jgi:serine/threonine protein kinase